MLKIVEGLKVFRGNYSDSPMEKGSCGRGSKFTFGANSGLVCRYGESLC